MQASSESPSLGPRPTPFQQPSAPHRAPRAGWLPQLGLRSGLQVVHTVIAPLPLYFSSDNHQNGLSVHALAAGAHGRLAQLGFPGVAGGPRALCRDREGRSHHRGCGGQAEDPQVRR